MQTNKYHMIPFIWGTQNREFIEKESRIQVSGVGGGGRRQWELQFNGYRVSLGMMKKFSQ